MAVCIVTALCGIMHLYGCILTVLCNGIMHRNHINGIMHRSVLRNDIMQRNCIVQSATVLYIVTVFCNGIVTVTVLCNSIMPRNRIMQQYYAS